MAAAAAEANGGCGKKRKRSTSGLGDLHDDMLERVLARLPQASYFRLRGVSRRWRAAAESNTFRAACASVPHRDPWFLMLQDSAAHRGPHEEEDNHHHQPPAVVYDSAERAWARWRGAPGPAALPVAAAGGLVLYRDAATGNLTVVNPLTCASRALPPPPTAASALQAVAMYGSPYRVVLILGELPDLSMATFDSTTNAWDSVLPLSRKPADNDGASSTRERAAEEDDDDAVYFLSKSGDVVATTMQRSLSRQYSCAVACGVKDADAAVAYLLSPSGTIVACDLARHAFAELPRILPAWHEYSIDVVACGGDRAYAVVLAEFLDTASLRVWELDDAGRAWRQVAAMPPAMSHAFRGAKADVNCVGHGDRVVVCVTSGEAAARGCFVCDVRSNRWEELTCGDGDAATDFVAALSFEPRMEAAV